MGINGNTGGLCLNQMITTKQIMEELQLKKNAMVLFKSVCGGAGSSASDESDIGIEEANTRVSDYAQPFFSIGAACYYAGNFDNSCVLFLTAFLDGKTVKECYQKTINYTNVKIEISKPYSIDNKKKITISSTKNSGMTTLISYVDDVRTVKKFPAFKEYDNAYVANPDFTIAELTD